MTGGTDRDDPNSRKMLSGWRLSAQPQCVSLFLRFIFQPACVCLLFVCLYASQPVCIFTLSAVTLSIHRHCHGWFEVTELSILVISGCHHKRLRATSLNSQKGPCVPTKKPLLCNALMLPLLMLLLTKIESRRKTEGMRVGQGRGVETSRGGKMEECVLSHQCNTVHELRFLYFMYFHAALHSVINQGQYSSMTSLSRGGKK